MANQPPRQTGDPTPVTGGVDLPLHLSLAVPCEGEVPTDELGRQAYWLLKLNADKVALQFRQSDLAAMDDATKRQLIADIQCALGIAPFTKAVL